MTLLVIPSSVILSYQHCMNKPNWNTNVPALSGHPSRRSRRPWPCRRVRPRRQSWPRRGSTPSRRPSRSRRPSPTRCTPHASRRLWGSETILESDNVMWQICRLANDQRRDYEIIIDFKILGPNSIEKNDWKTNWKTDWDSILILWHV